MGMLIEIIVRACLERRGRWPGGGLIVRSKVRKQGFHAVSRIGTGFDKGFPFRMIVRINGVIKTINSTRELMGDTLEE